MTTAQYLEALKTMELLPHSKKTAAVLGVSLRQIQRYAAGAKIPKSIALLVESRLIFGSAAYTV